VDGAAKSTRLRGQVSGEGWQRLVVVAGVVGELDCDWLGGALGDGAVELLDGALGLNPLVESDESDSLGQACETGTLVLERKENNGSRSETRLALFYSFFNSIKSRVASRRFSLVGVYKCGAVGCVQLP
jgi:hypothetical protein